MNKPTYKHGKVQPENGRADYSPAGATHSPEAMPASVELQRRLGNFAMRRLLQAKLSASRPDDAGLHGVRSHADDTQTVLERPLGTGVVPFHYNLHLSESAYRPESTVGRLLLTHELIHIKHGGLLNGMPALQREAQPQQPDGRVNACLSQTDEILPRGVGLLTVIDRELQLEAILGSEYPPLRQQIRQNIDARRFVCEAGVPAIVALWDTRTDQGALDVAAARHALSSQRERYTRYVMPRRRQERRLAEAEQNVREVGRWASRQTRAQGLASSLLLPTLPAPQRTNLQQSITRLQDTLPAMEAAGTQIGGLTGRLGPLIDELSNARRRVIDPENGVTQARIALGRAATAMDAIMTGLHAAQEQANVDALANEGERVQRGLNALIDQGEAINQEDIDTLRDQSRTFRTHVRETGEQLRLWPGSARKVMFLLRYLLALNTPNFANAPDTVEVERYRAQLDMIGEDLNRLFGGGIMMDRDLEFIIDAARRIKAQLDVRVGMEQALGHTTALVPGQTDVQQYFAGLARQPNDAVDRAYQDYAGAFFEHRVVASAQDLTIANIDDVFSRPPGAVGVRGLVCSGYAVLGARLFELAGGRVVNFIIGVRASNAQLLAGNTFDDVHALAQIQRNGQRLFISNDRVVAREQDGIGPNAVAWSNPNNPIYIGRGNTIAAALANVQQLLQQRIQQLQP